MFFSVIVLLVNQSEALSPLDAVNVVIGVSVAVDHASFISNESICVSKLVELVDNVIDVFESCSKLWSLLTRSLLNGQGV